MTPYVELQEVLFSTFCQIKEKYPADLSKLAKICDPKKVLSTLPPRGRLILEKYVVLGPEKWVWESCVEIIREMIVVHGSEVSIRNIRGMPLQRYGRTLTLEEYATGNGDNYLRTAQLAQPSALRKGDILATGCEVLSEPREGGNGSVLIHITGGFNGAWIDVASRIPIALSTPSRRVPRKPKK